MKLRNLCLQFHIFIDLKFTQFTCALLGWRVECEYYTGGKELRIQTLGVRLMRIIHVNKINH